MKRGIAFDVRQAGWLRLVVIGCALEIVFYLYFYRSFPLLEHYARPLMDLGKIAGPSAEAGYAFLLAMAALFALYYAAFTVARNLDGRYFWIVALFGTIFSATLILVYPVGAADVFDYIAEARVLSVYDENPFVAVPADFPGDPFLPYVAWPYAPAAYGPAWAWISAAVTLIAGDDLLSNILAFKLLATAFYLASIWTVKSILVRTAPAYTLAGTLLFAWNPLVVSEVAANAHNDIAMVFLLLLGIYFLGRDRKELAIAALTLSFLLKLITVALLPLFLATAARRIQGTTHRLRFLTFSILISACLTALFYLPLWAGIETLSITRRQEMFTVSLPTLALTFLAPITGEEIAGLWLSRAAALALAAFVALQTWRSRPETSSAIKLSFEVLFFYLVVTCLWFQPWYVLWLVALGSLLVSLDIAYRSMLFSYTVTMVYFVFVFLWVWNARSLDWAGVQRQAVFFVYTLPIAYTAFNFVRTRLASRIVGTPRA